MTLPHIRRRAEIMKAASEAKRRAGLTYPVGRPNREAHADAMEQLKHIPPDTRDLTGRICGDPLPGRSALDQRPISRG